MLYEVLRPFPGDRLYEAGEVVDATGWRNAQKLVDMRYLRPVAATPITGVEQPPASGAEPPTTDGRPAAGTSRRTGREG